MIRISLVSLHLTLFRSSIDRVHPRVDCDVCGFDRRAVSHHSLHHPAQVPRYRTGAEAGQRDAGNGIYMSRRTAACV